jgi:hypothetical protein
MHVNSILLRPDIPAIAKKLLGKLDRSNGPESCWPWMGTRRPDGYGVLYIPALHPGDRQTVTTHRLAYVLAHERPLPDSFVDRPTWVLHHCDNPPCCNPSHLFLGNSRTNVDDKMQKGRQQRGETVGTSKLTEDQVEQILDSQESRLELATRYKVTVWAIEQILRRRAWAHVATRRANLPEPHKKLTPTQKAAIRADFRADAAIADTYDVPLAQVMRIKYGGYWRTLTGELDKRHAKR